MAAATDHSPTPVQELAGAMAMLLEAVDRISSVVGRLELGSIVLHPEDEETIARRASEERENRIAELEWELIVLYQLLARADADGND